MLHLVEAYNSHGEFLSLPLQPNSPGFVVADIQGLEPVNASLSSSNFALMDGAQFQAARREARNLRITLEFDPDFVDSTVTSLRQQLYSFFMPKSTVKMMFYVDGLDPVFINGVVETFETALFSAEPAVVVSIMCFDPDLLVDGVVTISDSTTSGSTFVTYTYPGTVDTGLKFTMTADRTMTGVTIYHRDAGLVVRPLYVDLDILSGDIVEINTVPGQRYIRRTRSSVVDSVIYAIGDGSIWTMLGAGEFGLYVYSPGAPVAYTIEYMTRLGGL